MKNYLLSILLCLICAGSIFGQAENTEQSDSITKVWPRYWSDSKEIGLNVTPLISQLIPFNLGSNEAGLIGLSYRKYYDTKALRINFGANITDNEINNGSPFFYLSVGTEKRYTLGKKWYYTSGWDLLLYTENDDDGAVFAMAKTYGIDYHFTERFFLSTQAQWLIGLQVESGLVIRMIPPAAIFFNVRLY